MTQYHSLTASSSSVVSCSMMALIEPWVGHTFQRSSWATKTYDRFSVSHYSCFLAPGTRFSLSFSPNLSWSPCAYYSQSPCTRATLTNQIPWCCLSSQRGISTANQLATLHYEVNQCLIGSHFPRLLPLDLKVALSSLPPFRSLHGDSKLGQLPVLVVHPQAYLSSANR